MRKFIIILSLLLTIPALAQAWSTYANARYGATATIPPGFEPTGPEASNSDGLIYRSRDGSLLTIYGADVPGSDFAAYIESTVAFEKSYHGWTINGLTITPEWAEYNGSIGGRFMSVRTLSTCNGRQAISTKFEYSGNMSSSVSKVEQSLKAGSASSC